MQAIRQAQPIAQAGKAAGRAALAIGGLPAGAGLLGIGAVGSTAAIGLAAALGYGIGTAARRLWQHLTPSERLYRKALATREARLKFELEQGRKATAAEVKAIASSFRAAVEHQRGK